MEISFWRLKHKLSLCRKKKVLRLSPLSCCTLDEVESISTGRELFITWHRAHSGSRDMLNLNPAFLELLPSLSICDSLSQPLYWWLTSSKSDLIWLEYICWFMLSGGNLTKTSLVFCSILKDRRAGSFQTKIQPSAPTWSHQQINNLPKRL